MYSGSIIPFYSEFLPYTAGFDPLIIMLVNVYLNSTTANDLSHHGWIQFLKDMVWIYGQVGCGWLLASSLIIKKIFIPVLVLESYLECQPNGQSTRLGFPGCRLETH